MAVSVLAIASVNSSSMIVKPGTRGAAPRTIASRQIPVFSARSETVRYGFSFRNAFSPMPFTFIRSSGFLNVPFFCRYSRIRSAPFAPMPGRVSSCACVAVFRLIGATGAAACLAAGTALDDGGLDEGDDDWDFCWAAAGSTDIAATASIMSNTRIVSPPLKEVMAPIAGIPVAVQGWAPENDHDARGRVDRWQALVRAEMRRCGSRKR